MRVKQFRFQQRAVSEIFNNFEIGKKDIVLEAPTGSGKTVMLLQFMEKVAEIDSRDIAFVWLTPGAGELEEQQWAKASNSSRYLIPQRLDDIWEGGFSRSTVTFINWEAVTNKKTIARRGGDVASIESIVKREKLDGRKFVLVIDEEHRNQTVKAQDVVDMFDAISIIRASATPVEDDSLTAVKVTEGEAIFEHLITRRVVLNEGLSVDNEAADYLYF